MDDQSDETLLNLYFAGDADAFRAFHARHAGRVIGYAMGKGLRRELATEVCQDAFLRLHRSIHSYENGKPALPWFFTIVHNCLMDALRQGKKLSVLQTRMAEEQMTVAPATQNPVTGEPAASLAMLSDEQRQVFEMRVLGEQSFSEIALETGKSEVSLRKAFERARRKLKDLLAGEK